MIIARKMSPPDWTAVNTLEQRDEATVGSYRAVLTRMLWGAPEILVFDSLSSSTSELLYAAGYETEAIGLPHHLRPPVRVEAQVTLPHAVLPGKEE